MMKDTTQFHSPRHAISQSPVSKPSIQLGERIIHCNEWETQDLTSMRALLHHSTQTQKDIIVCNNYRHHSSLQNFVVSCYNIWWACKNYIQYIYQRWLTVGQSAKYTIEI